MASGWPIGDARWLDSAAMSGLTDLAEILATMTPEVRPGRYVFVTSGQPLDAVAMVAEVEGVSWVVTEQQALDAGLGFDGVFGWITLGVHSALESVGLTAAVAGALARDHIACNVIAGLRHDHLLVPAERVADAVGVLNGLQRQPKSVRS